MKDENVVTYKEPSKFKDYIMKKRPAEFGWGVLFIIAAVCFFSVYACNCDKDKGICTFQSRGPALFWGSETETFKIKEFNGISINHEHWGRNINFDKIKINIRADKTGYSLDPLFHYYTPFSAQNFSKELTNFIKGDFKDGNEKIFKYRYYSPLSIFLFLAGIILLLESIFPYKKHLSDSNISVLYKNPNLYIGLFITALALQFVIWGMDNGVYSPFSTEKTDTGIYMSYVNQYHKTFNDRNYDSALENLRQAEKINNEDYELYIKMADLYRKKKDYQSAIINAQKAIELIDKGKKSLIANESFFSNDSFDEKLEALDIIAKCYKKQNDFENAKKYYDELINTNVDPNRHSDAYYNRGICLYNLGKKKEAYEDFVKYRMFIIGKLEENSFSYSAGDLAEVHQWIRKTGYGDYSGASSLSDKDLLNGYEKININPPSKYDSLTKNEIYDLRKKYAASSIFAKRLYKPNEEVFGQIEDKKPWYGLETAACPWSFPDITKGMSARSVYINNPALLLGVINTLGYSYPFSSKFCSNKLLQFVPRSMYFDPKKKMVIVKYDADETLLRNIAEPKFIMPLSFTGLNARDLGYKYVFAYDSYNVKFQKPDNVSQNVYELRDFLHTGGSCKIPGGCTNISPLQPQFDFYITKLPAGITFKLWKRSPAYNTQGGDIYLKVLFEKL